MLEPSSVPTLRSIVQSVYPICIGFIVEKYIYILRIHKNLSPMSAARQIFVDIGKKIDVCAALSLIQYY